MKVPTNSGINRVILVTIDCLRWDFHSKYRELYPDGVWFRGTSQSTFTPPSHASMFTGLNPHRHRVFEFGDKIRVDNIFDSMDSVCLSNLVNGNKGLNVDCESPGIGDVIFTDFLEGDEFEDGITWQLEPRNTSSDVLDWLEGRDPDLTWFHDWLVHGSGSVHSESEWTRTVDLNNSYSENRDNYAYHVDLSVEAHEKFIDELKKRGMYDDTLFILWGDHGQGLGKEPFKEFFHGCHATEEISRVPFGFCCELFDQDESGIDMETNVRSVDIVDTLESIVSGTEMEWLGLYHETDGVDLTEFVGELVGFTYGGLPDMSNHGSSVRTANTEMINVNDKHTWNDEFQSGRTVFETPPSENSLDEEYINDSPMLNWLSDVFDSCRTREPCKESVISQQPTAFMEDMGYL